MFPVRICKYILKEKDIYLWVKNLYIDTHIFLTLYFYFLPQVIRHIYIVSANVSYWQIPTFQTLAILN